MNENLISGYTKTIRILIVKIRKLISLSGPQHLTKKSVSQKKTSIVCLVGRRGKVPLLPTRQTLPEIYFSSVSLDLKTKYVQNDLAQYVNKSAKYPPYRNELVCLLVPPLP